MTGLEEALCADLQCLLGLLERKRVSVKRDGELAVEAARELKTTLNAYLEGKK